MEIKVNGISISIENSTPAAPVAPTRTIESFAADMENIIRSEEAMDTTLTLMSNLAKAKALKGQEGFAETMKNVGSSIANFFEKLIRAISQFIGNKIAEAQIKKLENTLSKSDAEQFYVSKEKKEGFETLAKEFGNSKPSVSDGGLAKTLGLISQLAGPIADWNNAIGAIKNKLVIKDAEAYVFGKNEAMRILNSAKTNYPKVYADLKTTVNDLNKILAELKKQEQADGNIAVIREIGKYSGKAFKTVFSYCNIIGSMKPYIKEAAAPAENKKEEPKA
jgi:hypothetical protein